MSHYPFINANANPQPTAPTTVFESRSTAQQQFNKIVNEVMQAKTKQKQLNPILSTTEKKKCKLHPVRPSKVCRECRQNEEEPVQKTILQASEPEKKADGVFQLNCDTPLYHINEKLKKNVMSSDYFKGLYSLRRFDEVVHEIQQVCNSVETFQKGSMEIPTRFMCLFYKLLLMRLSIKEVNSLLNHPNCYVKAAGLLYVRMLCKYSDIYPLLSRHFDDQTVFYPTVDKSQEITIGAYAQRLLQQLSHYQLRLPRIPLKLDRQVQEMLSRHQPQTPVPNEDKTTKPKNTEYLGILAIVKTHNATIKMRVLQLGSQKIVVEDSKGNQQFYDYDEVELVDDTQPEPSRSRSRSRDRNRRRKRQSSSDSEPKKTHVIPTSVQSLKANIKKLSSSNPPAANLSRYVAPQEQNEYMDPLMETDRQEIIRLG